MRLVRVRLGLFAVTALCSQPALAQIGASDTPPQSDAKGRDQTRPSSETGEVAAPTDTGGLGDIIVTAQRREENLQRAALAVSVVQGADLVSAGITRPDRLGELVPALTVQSSGAGNIFFVRGVGNFTTTANSDPATAFNYDGVYIGRPNSTGGKFFDLARIEVLKGPQGTLYGRNATAGAINVIPVQPLIGELSGYAIASYGNYDALTAEGAINLPLGARGAIRLSANVVDREGYLRDGTSDDVQRSLRFQMKAELTPSLTVRVATDYTHVGGLGVGLSYVENFSYNPTTRQFTFNPSNLPVSEGLYTAASQAYRRTVTAGATGRTFDALAPRPFQDNDFYGVNAEVSLDTGLGTVTVVPAWRYADLRFVQEAGGFLTRTREKDEQFSLEARLAGTAGPLDYIVGGYFFDESINTRGPGGNLSSSLSFFNGTLYTTRSYAGFARGTLRLGEHLRLVGAVRYTKDDKHTEADTDTLSITCTVLVAGVRSCPNAPLINYTDALAQQPFANIPARGAPAAPIPGTGAVLGRAFAVTDRSASFDRVTYRLAAEFDVAEESLLYASFETGYRSGGFNGAVGYEVFQPEFLDAYTLGIKNRFLDRRVQLNVEAFYWKYRDQQVSHLGIDRIGRAATFTENIGRSTIKGVEVEARVLPTPTTLISADVQYLDAQNEEFAYDVLVGTAGPPLTSCPVTPTGAPSTFRVDCAGFPAFNSPKWTVNLAGQQTVELGDYRLIAGVDTQYRSSRYSSFGYLPSQITRSNWLTNAQVSFAPASDAWSLAAFVRNIENNRVVQSFGTHPTGNLTAVQVSAPRTYGARVAVKF